MLICPLNERWRSSFNATVWPSGTVHQLKKQKGIRIIKCFSLSLCVCVTIHYITYYLLVFLVLCSGMPPPPSIAFTVSVVCWQRIRVKKENAKSSVACLLDAKTDESLDKFTHKHCRHTNIASHEHTVLTNRMLVFANCNFSKGIKGSAQPYFRKIFARKQQKNWWSIAWEWALSIH